MSTQQHSQTRGAFPQSGFGLSMLTGIVSPYYVDRNIYLIRTTMLLKCFVLGYTQGQLGINVNLEASDASISASVTVPLSVAYSDTDATIRPSIEGLISSYCTGFFGIQAPDVFVWDFVTPTDLVASLPASVVINSATHSIVTGTGATGFQVSATRNAFVNYNTTIATTASIGGNASGTLVLEVAPTNSATAGDWVEISRFTNGQAISLALTLQSVQTLAAPLSGMVPAGYYVKIRSINNSGTPTYTYNSGREILQ